MSEEIKNVPKHVAIIPDGNRRWAKTKGLQLWFGHRAGVKAFEEILEKSRELKIPYTTFWGSSWDNLTKRPKAEINFLFRLYTEQFKRVIKDKRIHQNKVKINVLGRWREILPKTTQEAVEKAIEATKDYNNYFLTFLLAYDGTDEMLNCVQKIAKLAEDKKINPVRNSSLNGVKITKELIKDNLWTKDLPPVDLLIRTGCKNDPHLSAGFMMWDTAYSQVYFTQTLFPAFAANEFTQIIEDYSRRERRMGG